MQYTQSVLKHTLIFPAGREKASTQNGMKFFFWWKFFEIERMIIYNMLNIYPIYQRLLQKLLIYRKLCRNLENTEKLQRKLRRSLFKRCLEFIICSNEIKD